jgi:hypothetical protein
MRSTTRTALVLAALTAALYFPRLGYAPIYLAPDEVFIGVQAHSIATTGRDVGGRFLPFYVEYEYGVSDAKRPLRHGWLPPIIYYAIAAVLTILPLSESDHPHPERPGRHRRRRVDVFDRPAAVLA